ncbi:uncharacterized protein LOC118200097 [Stegodyphus dumicola]|uniref:uncharacterized protein LOC118200097 n=1 Tax=Stegodyphus dumicola TaxID=202533 RepID=UPI0015AF9F4A|nr:uncharacterized protein LOC118200097 [Stegodyphus dumicola]
MSAKLSRKCFVPGCISGHQNATKASLFKVPKDENLRREWAKRISRGDTELSIHHSVCELHFEEHFIEKYYHHIVNGEEIKIPRGKPLLKPEAIPSIFPNAPKKLVSIIEKNNEFIADVFMCGQKTQSVTFNAVSELMYSKKCAIKINESATCVHCKYVNRLLKKKICKNNYLKSKLSNNRKNKLICCLRKKITELSLKLKEQKTNEMGTSVVASNPKQLLAINAFNNASKRKSTQGMIYDPKWLIECIIMRMKGPKLYEHIRENKILIVPGKNCLQRYVKNYRSGFGFCDSVFQAIKVKTQSMEPYFLHGGILIDEMKLSENLHVSSDGQIEGFVDLGNFQNGKKQSNHGLVFLFQPFVGDWKQIVAVFATCNNIKGTLLADLIIEATILLENAGLYVDFITCDGATWNKVMWKKFGIGTQSDNTTEYQINHPCDENTQVKFYI